MNPFNLLNSAIKAVPAVKYALGIAGIISVIAIVAGFGIDYRVAVIGGIIMIILMTLLVVFVGIAGSAGALAIPATIFTYFVILLVISTSSFLFSSVFFSWPIDLQYWLTGDNGSSNNGSSVIVDETYLQYSNVGSLFGVYIDGEGSVETKNDQVVIKIDKGQIRLNPNLDDSIKATVVYLTAKLATNDPEGWTTKNSSESLRIDKKLLSKDDLYDMKDLEFRIPTKGIKDITNFWIVFAASSRDGGIWYSHSDRYVFEVL